MKSKTKIKKITMNDLAGMVQRGFIEVSGRFTKVDEQFIGVNTRLDEVDNRFDGVDKRFDGVDKRFDGVDGRLNHLDKRLDDIGGRLNKLEKSVSGLKEDFGKVLSALDKVAKHYEDYLIESMARDVEMKRIKRWVEQIAQKVGVQLVD